MDTDAAAGGVKGGAPVTPMKSASKPANKKDEKEPAVTVLDEPAGTRHPHGADAADEAEAGDDATPEAPLTVPPGAFAMQRQKAVVYVVIGAVVVAFLGWLIGSQIESPSDVAARSAAPPASPIFEPVKEQQLSTVVRARGTGGFGSPRPVTLPASNLSGGTVITSLPVANDVIQEAGVLATISGRPVFALQGDAPMYRDMGPGMSGPDVAQLETSLLRVGYNPGTVDGFYDAATEAAVRQLYVNAGFQPVVASLAQLDAVRAAQCGTDASSCPGPGVQVPVNEVFFVAGAPVQVGEVPATVGAEAAGPLMTVSDSTPKVIGQLRVSESKLVKEGMRVDIDEPDLGIEARGKVTSVADRPGTNGLDQFHVYFETSVDNAPDRLNGVSVRVVIPIKSTKDKELTVPQSAVSLAADGTSRVQVLRKGELRDVEVEPGLSADGFVVVKPAQKNALEPGDKVVVGFDQRGG
jgi:hypothetical protein